MQGKISNSAERLNELKKIYGISQVDICKKTGLDKSTMSLYFSGKHEPRQDKISLICDAYNIDPAWLMGYDVPMKKNDVEKYNIENARLLNEIKNNAPVREFIKTFLKLSDANKKVVIAMVNTMYEANQNET